MIVAITGATGFIGSNLVRYFARCGHRVIAYGRGFAPEELKRYASGFVRADLKGVWPSIEADACIHAAGLATDKARLRELRTANVKGTANVFRAAKNCNTFVHISSSSVYDHLGPVFRETHDPDVNSLSPYGISKWEAERLLLRERQTGPRICILRPRAVYGVGDRVILPNILRLVKRGGIVFLPGKLDILSSMTHVENLCLAVESCLHQKAVSGIFNIADEKPYQVSEAIKGLLDSVCSEKLVYVNLPIGILRKWVSVKAFLGLRVGLTPQRLQYLTQSVILDINKAKTKLAYSPGRNYRDSLDKWVSWIKKVGRPKILETPAELPWLKCACVRQ